MNINDAVVIIRDLARNIKEYDWEDLQKVLPQWAEASLFLADYINSDLPSEYQKIEAEIEEWLGKLDIEREHLIIDKLAAARRGREAADAEFDALDEELDNVQTQNRKLKKEIQEAKGWLREYFDVLDSEELIPMAKEAGSCFHTVIKHHTGDIEKAKALKAREKNTRRDLMRARTELLELKEPELDYNGLYCAACGEPQFNSPSGVTCKNGHGGEEGVEKDD